MLEIYLKQLRKKWLAYSAVSFVTALFSFFMVVIWPSFEPYVESLQEMMELPIYQALLGEGAALTTVESLLTMELFIISDIFFMGVILLVGVQSITREVDSGSLDFMLSFPIRRSRFLLEKLFAFITISATYPIFTVGAAIIGSLFVPGVDFHPRGLPAFFLGLFGRWVLYLTLTCLVIFISTVFMDTSKTLGFGGLLIGVSWILDTLAGIIRIADEGIADILQYTSLYYYLDGISITDDIIKDGYGAFPFLQLVFILAIGVGAILLALFLFDNPIRQKREFK